MKKVHFISGLVITPFVGVHLFNHFTSLFGAAKHIEMMDLLRTIYRNRIIESLLLIAVITQIFSGIKLFFAKRKTVQSFFEKLQIWSGMYLAIFLVFHVSAIIIGRYLLKLDTNIYFGAAGLNTFPINLFFIPYYALAILSFFGHIAAIHYQKMQNSIFGISVSLQSKFILAIGFIVTLFIFYGLTNSFNGLPIPNEYNIMIGK